MNNTESERNEVKNKETLDNFLNTQPFGIFGIGVNTYNRKYLHDVENKFHSLALRETPRKPGAPAKNTLELTIFDDTDLTVVKANSLTVLTNHHSKEYIASKAERALILPYKGYAGMKEYCEKNGYLLATADADIVMKIDNKETFRLMLAEMELNAYVAPHVSFDPSQSSYKDLAQKLDSNTVVAQISKSGGGKGTFFISSEKEYEEFLNNEFTIKGIEVGHAFIASKFVSGVSASISAVATRWGTFTSTLQVQINKDESAAAFRGHDWIFSNTFVTRRAQEKAKSFASKFGEEIYKIGYQGFFGIDLLITQEDCYVVECNPRITGALPILDMVQDQNNKPSFIGIHVMEFLADDISVQVDYDQLQNELDKITEKGASHFFIVQKEAIERTVTKTLPEGTYKVANRKLTYMDARNHPAQLKSEDEFILAETPELGRIIKENGRLARVVATREALEADGKTTKSWVKEIETLVEDAIK